MGFEACKLDVAAGLVGGFHSVEGLHVAVANLGLILLLGGHPGLPRLALPDQSQHARLKLEKSASGRADSDYGDLVDIHRHGSCRLVGTAASAAEDGADDIPACRG